jgi:glucose/arabinose dehydrogenase/cytochrome c2
MVFFVTDRVCEGAEERFWVEEVAAALSYPSSVVWLPNGDALIAEREGGIRILRNDKLDPNRLEGVPANFQNSLNGIKDLALDPDFSLNGKLYLLISEGTYDHHYAAIYCAELRGDKLTDLNRIFRSKGDIGGVGASAGRMLFLHDKTLLVGVPEDDLHKKMAQDLSSHIGKILRIDREGGVPSDNPFLHVRYALPEIWTYGHRVQTGLYLDPGTNLVWEVEPGPRGGDELNMLAPGQNFGWAQASWGFDYTGKLAAPTQFGPGVEDPVFVWMSSSAPSGTPSGITRYSGHTFPQWDGDFFVGLLSGRSLDRLRIRGGVVVLRERLLMELEERIRDVRVGPDNKIYVLTDHPSGRMLRIQPGEPDEWQKNRRAMKLSSDVWRNENVPSQATPKDIALGRKAFLKLCSQCHAVGSVVRGGKLGPDLMGILERNAGSAAGYAYSKALSGSPQVWGTLSLALFLADPAGYAPGTTMTAPPVTDEKVRQQIISFLADPTKQSVPTSPVPSQLP